jgi:hypothetical protein
MRDEGEQERWKEIKKQEEEKNNEVEVRDYNTVLCSESVMVPEWQFCCYA